MTTTRTTKPLTLSSFFFIYTNGKLDRDNKTYKKRLLVFPIEKKSDKIKGCQIRVPGVLILLSS